MSHTSEKGLYHVYLKIYTNTYSETKPNRFKCRPLIQAIENCQIQSAYLISVIS